MRLLRKIKHPKLTTFVIMVIIAYIIFSKPIIQNFFSRLALLSYFGALIAGLLYAFGFTSPIATGIFLTMNPPNIFLAAFLGGAGALLIDILIYKFTKISFEEEFQDLGKSNAIKSIKRTIKKNLSGKILKYLNYLLAAVIIGSPLPDEAGITILAGLSKINLIQLIIISYICNTIGIFVILLIAQ